MRHRAALGKDIFLRVRGLWLVLGLILSALALWRDEGPQDLQPPLLSEVAGWLPLWAWAVIVLLILQVLTFEGAYRLVKNDGEEGIIEALSDQTKDFIVRWERELVRGIAAAQVKVEIMSELREHDLLETSHVADETSPITGRSPGEYLEVLLNQRGNRILRRLKQLHAISSE